MKLLFSLLILFVYGCNSVDEQKIDLDCQKRVVYQLKEKCEFEVGQKVFCYDKYVGEIYKVDGKTFNVCAVNVIENIGVYTSKALKIEAEEDQFIRIYAMNRFEEINDGMRIDVVLESEMISLPSDEMKSKVENLLNKSEKIVDSIYAYNFDSLSLEQSLNELIETLDSLNLKSEK